MRRLRLLVLLACGLGGLWAGASLGGAGIGLPTITLPTLPVSVSVPTPTLPVHPPPPPPPAAPQPPPPPPPAHGAPPPPPPPAHAATRGHARVRVKARAKPRTHSAPTPGPSTRPAQQSKTPPPPPQASRAAYTPSRATLPHGLLTAGALVPSVRKLPFLVLALVGLAIVLLALGAIPASLAPHPAAAEVLTHRRAELALGGLATLVAAITAYLLV